MDLLPTPEQDEIIATVRSQLDRDFDLHALAALDGADSVVDRSLWERCAALGWFGLGLDEPLGGVGYTLVEEALLFAELGAHATPGPFLATVLGGRLAALAGHAELAGRILAGELVVALAEPEGDGPAVVGPTVDGSFRVTDHGGADLLLVMTDDHAALVGTRRPGAPGPGLDRPARAAGHHRGVRARGAGPPGRRLGAPPAGHGAGGGASWPASPGPPPSSPRSTPRTASSSGGPSARSRRSSTAARTWRSGPRRPPAWCATPRWPWWTGCPTPPSTPTPPGPWPPTPRSPTRQVNVQNHGGIGFTWEHTAHRFVTRAQVRTRTLGDRRTHLALLMDQPAPA